MSNAREAPAVPRIDAHQHFIDDTPEDYPWIDDRMQTLRRAYLPADLKPLLDDLSFDGCIAVQARQSSRETEWLLQLAEEHDWIRGVVGWVDLRSPDVRQQLERYSRSAKLRGVRHVIHDEPDDDFILGEDFNRGIALLHEFGLTYDLLVFEKHLPQTIRFVGQHPRQRFVVDHLAKPNVKAQAIDDWSRRIRTLAAHGNVYAKLSGLVTEADWHGWREAEFTPYLDAAFEAFGPERLMIGSDWPVCTVSRDYRSVMNVVIRYLDRRCTPRERERVLGGNAARFYGIGQGEDRDG